MEPNTGEREQQAENAWRQLQTDRWRRVADEAENLKSTKKNAERFDESGQHERQGLHILAGVFAALQQSINGRHSFSCHEAAREHGGLIAGDANTCLL